MNDAQTEVQKTQFADARKVLSGHFYGVLSTNSKKFPGHPFGSVVPYCLDATGTPLILISRLAQHTQNIEQDNKISLVILDRTAGNVQTDARLTLVGQAQKVPADKLEDCASRYCQHFPSAKEYHTELDFEFYTLNIETMRYISGFGEARWLSPGDVLLANPFTFAEEERIAGHMNADHSDALLHYYNSAPIPNKESAPDTEQISMVGMDAEGLALRVAEDLHRIEFLRPVTNALEARKMLVEMAKS